MLLVQPHRAPREGGAKIVLFNKISTVSYYSFLCMLEFWQRLLSMIDKVSKSLQSKDISTSTAARMFGGWKVTIYRVCKMLQLMKSLQQGLQTMLKRWIFGIPDQLPEKRKKYVRRIPSKQARDEGIDLTPQQKFSNECLEVYIMMSFSAWFSGDSKNWEKFVMTSNV